MTPKDNSLIEYGGYKSDVWYGIDSFENEKFQDFLKEIKSKPYLFSEHGLYLAGSILEDWISWDADFVITGPYIPSNIRSAMTWITHLGFKHGIYPDVVYLDELFDLYEWQQNPQIQGYYKMHNKNPNPPEWASTKKTIYHFSNTFIKNGDSKHLSEDGKWKDGMWSREVVFPYTKNYEAVANGHLYKKAIKIF